MIHKYFYAFSVSFLFAFSGVYGQSENQLTDQEQAYRDSIEALNAENERAAVAQDAYNAGIEFFQNKKYKESIAQFNKAIEGDSSFQFAYFNKGVAR